MRYRHRTVLVTGGARGIGAGCVRRFAAEGAQVAFIDRDRTAAEALARELASSPGGAPLAIAGDVTDHGALRAAIAAAAALHGRLDALINNAGWHPPERPIDAFGPEDLRALLELNLVAPFVAAQAALPHLRQSRGCIVNVASLVGQVGQHLATTYAATKGALLAFTRALAMEEAAHGVRVNSVSPGNIRTPLFDAWLASVADTEAALALAASAQWIRRLGTPDEVALACLYLAADATFTTGADLPITGGAELGYGTKPAPATPGGDGLRS